MKKKFIILALCTGMLVPMAAQAQKVELASDNPQEVIFSDNIAPETLGICFVVKKGGSIDDDNMVYALKNAKSDKDGKFEISFVMPEEKNSSLSDGEYEIYIKESGKEVKKADVEFVYASLDTRENLLDKITKIPQDETKVAKLKEILEDEANTLVFKAIGCDTEHYSEITATNMCEKITDFATVTLDVFKNEYNIACVISEFKDVDKETANEYLTVINPVFDGTKYSDITDKDLTDWLSTYFTQNAYSSENYEIANILYKLNTVVADDIDELFDKYDESLKITEDDRYKKYDQSTNKAAINIEIAEILAKTPAKTVEDILKAVASAMDTGNGGGGNGGGNGGGGGSSPIVPPVASTTNNTSFNDLNQAEWARTAVVSLANAGIISGDENGNFRPNDYVTREEYVKMLVVAANKHNIYASCDFDDVSKDAWYYTYIASAKQHGLTSGISEKEFGTGRALTRQDMAVLSLKAKGDVAKVREDVTFEDDSKIAEYAKDAVSKLYMSGAINGIGNNKFAPKGQATRAECAQIIYNLFLK